MRHIIVPYMVHEDLSQTVMCTFIGTYVKNNIYVKNLYISYTRNIFVTENDRMWRKTIIKTYYSITSFICFRSDNKNFQWIQHVKLKIIFWKQVDFFFYLLHHEIKYKLHLYPLCSTDIISLQCQNFLKANVSGLNNGHKEMVFLHRYHRKYLLSWLSIASLQYHFVLRLRAILEEVIWSDLSTPIFSLL